MWRFTRRGKENLPALSHRRGQSLVDFIIRRSKLIEKVFAIIFIITALCLPFVGINYDLSKYLPSDMPSKQGIDLMEEEFGYPGTARIMIADVSIYEAKTYKDRIAAIEGVDRVQWADAVTDINQSSLFIPYEEIDDYYQDGHAVMDITFTGNNSAASTRSAIQQMQTILGEKGSFSGPAVQEKFLNEIITKEMLYILIFGIFIILGLLTLATTSWFEPLVFLIVILISVVINMGSNIFFGTVSSITFSVAAVLQLAIAMDYTIILLDNFTKERKLQLPVEEALSNAIRKSIVTVSSAGAAAVVGFLALVLMRYGIGRDIGLVLAKGIAISMITVMTLTPAFVLRWYKIIESTQHKQLVPSFDKVAGQIYRFRWVTLILLMLIAVPAYVAKDMNDFNYGNEALGLSQGTTMYEDDQAITSKFGRSNLIMAIVPNSSMVTEAKLSEDLEELPYVKYVTSRANTLPDGVLASFLPDSITGQLHSDNYSRILIPIRTSGESELAFRAADEISKIVKGYYPENSYIIGVTPSTMDIKGVIVDDWSRIDKLSMLGVALAIGVAFRSLVLPIVLIIPIKMAVYVNMMVPYLLGARMMYLGFIVVSCLQLGATIDYSIVMTYHYLDQRKRHDKVTASQKATAASMLPILTSGLILAVAGYGLYFLSSVTALADLGRLVARGALLSMFMVIALLPNLFIWSDKMIMLGSKFMPQSIIARQEDRLPDVGEELEDESISQYL